ncbi:MAG: phosphoribosylamine--glycine ligase [Marinicaulis sp.]|nr:phosphoribosylamine--glycine ligase [Marinicaulis sp.]
MKVLLIGGGGREHALGWKIAQSPKLSKLYLAPGNPGLNQFGSPVDLSDTDIDGITKFAVEKSIDLVVVGPEAPLALGLGDKIRAAGIACFGPDKAAAELESSKSFMKDVCGAAGAPTADYGKFTEAGAAKAFLARQTPPYVIKADGLAAGKGVVVTEDKQEAEAAIDEMLAGRFGAAGATIVIEEFMHGEEASFFVVTDGVSIAPLIAAQDHKRAFDGDKGPNTGGMGAYSPTPVFTDTVRRRTMNDIVSPIVNEMRTRGTPYQGVLYFGLMIENEAPRLVEINARFGDPECQVIMRRMESDILPLLFAAATNTLSGQKTSWRDDAAALVVYAANGYPEKYEKGSAIAGVDAANAIDGVEVFHAGTRIENGALVSAGGRVLNVTATGASIKDAVARAYEAINEIDWSDGFYRKDIGWRAING